MMRYSQKALPVQVRIPGTQNLQHGFECLRSELCTASLAALGS